MTNDARSMNIFAEPECKCLTYQSTDQQHTNTQKCTSIPIIGIFPLQQNAYMYYNN